MGTLAIRDQSLRDLFQHGGEATRRARAMLARYHQLLGDVFPIQGEIETVAAYDAYLCDPSLEWDIIVLTESSSDRIIGGIQWQPLRNLNVS